MRRAPHSDPARDSPPWAWAHRESHSVVSAAAGATAIGRAARDDEAVVRGISVRRRGGAVSRPRNLRPASASGLWNRRRSAQAAVTPAGLAAAAAHVPRCPAADRAGDADRSDGSRAWGTRGRAASEKRAVDRARVLRWPREPGETGDRAPTASHGIGSAQIGSHVVPSQRCHNGDRSPGGSPQRSIPACRAGAAFEAIDGDSAQQKTEISNWLIRSWPQKTEGRLGDGARRIA